MRPCKFCDVSHLGPTSDEQVTSHLSLDDLNALHCALTGHGGARRWQRPLFTDLEVGRIPTDIELATGLGKTRDVRRRKDFGGSR